MQILEQPLHVKQGFLQLSGDNTPDVAPTGHARLWYDAANSQLKFSVNGGAFSENPGALSLQDLSAHVLTTAPAASAASAVLQLDSGTFAGSAAGTVLGINLNAGTADLINAQKAGVARFSVSETGIMTALKGIIGGATELANLSVFSTGTTVKGLAIQCVAVQTANAFEIQTSSGTRAVSYGGVGSTSSQYFELTNQSFGFFYNGRIGNNHRLGVTADGATSILCALKTHASQSANIFETLNSSSAVQLAINAAHSMRLFTVPTADATLAKLLFGTTGVLVGGSASGTYLGINAASGYAGDYLCFQANGATLTKIGAGGRVYAAVPNSAPTDGDIQNSGLTFYLNEATPAVLARIRKSDGTYLTLTIANGVNPTLA